MPETLLTDTTAVTAAADTVAPTPRPVSIPQLPWSTVCFEAAAPVSAADSIYRTTAHTAWMAGMDGVPRPVRPGYDSGVITLLLCSFMIVALGFRSGSRLWKSLMHDLVDVRRRSNAFDERTIGETWVVSAMILQTCIYTGLLIYGLLGYTGELCPDKPVFTTVAAMTGVAVCLYLLRLCGYMVTGYAFTDPTGRQLWIRGFNASQVLLGCLLIIPSLTATFYPYAAPAMLIVSACAYAGTEAVFISKGFRIFYNHLGSLLYFILYLCTLEIIPLIFAFYGA